MKPNSLQEKFQITVPKKPRPEAGDHWLPAGSDYAARRLGSARDVIEEPFVSKNSIDMDGLKFNKMPPGMEIDNQCFGQGGMPLSMAGETDVSADTNPTAFREGFKRLDMKGTDDQYSGEHMDHFYGEAVGDDGNVGFVERNNYLDRE